MVQKLRIPVLSSILLGALIFQASVIPDTLNIRPLGSAVNVTILIALIGLLIHTINHKKPLRVVVFYVLPIIFILLGDLMNFVRSVGVDSVGAAYVFLPWVAALSIPFLKSANTEKAWRTFYGFVLIVTLLTLAEYAAMFSGWLVPTTIQTARGVFFKGVISILHQLDGGVPHYRFYGVFAEPGTTAMFLLPALAYALVFSKRLAVLVFGLALYLTDSLGGLFASLIVVVLFVFWKLRELRYSWIAKMLPAVLIALIAIPSAEYFYNAYEKKQLSARVREENVSVFLNNFSASLVEHPIGFAASGKSLSTLKSEDDYYGSNFMFYVAFVQGGVWAFFGYVFIFMTSCVVTATYFLRRHNPDKISACVFISLPALLIFVVQRTTIFETVLFAFLFAGPVITMIGGGERVRETSFVPARTD